jgi:hypothetical protein
LAKRSPNPMQPANYRARQPGRGRAAASKGRPILGNAFDDRMRQRPGCNRCLSVCADCSASASSPLQLTLGPQRAFSKASRNLSVRCWFRKTKARNGATASRQPLRPSRTTRREDHVIPIVQMSSDRLFLEGLVATRAPLRFTGTINLPCSSAWTTPNRTFLLCQEEDISTLP